MATPTVPRATPTVTFSAPGVTISLVYRAIHEIIETISEARMEHLAKTAEDGTRRRKMVPSAVEATTT